MPNMTALKNTKNLTSWRRWQGEAYERSGFTAMLIASPMLTIAFVFACTFGGRALGRSELPVIMAGSGLFLATVLGLMAFAMLRLNAWKRANPWTPPS